RIKNFTVGLTDLDPRIGNSPLKLPYLICATHGPLGRFETVSLMCTHPLYARRRYLFVDANVDIHFHLAEVEVFNAVADATAAAAASVVVVVAAIVVFVVAAAAVAAAAAADDVHVYTEEKPLNAGPFDGYFKRCQVTETEPPVNGVTVCSFTCDNKRGCDYVIVRVFGRYGP
ncbi:hypothetical protein LSAT2_008806, partial [Lamellibrachia satsuma]